jgi:hypothetical protein
VRASYAPYRVTRHGSALALADALIALVLLLALIGHAHADAPPQWTISADAAWSALTDCVTDGSAFASTETINGG